MIKIMEAINGKKTIIGIIAKAALKLIAQLKPDMQGMVDTLDGYVDLWILGGVAHKLGKMETK